MLSISLMYASEVSLVEAVPKTQGANPTQSFYLGLLTIDIEAELIKYIANYRDPDDLPLADRDAIKNVRTWGNDPRHPFYKRINSLPMIECILNELSRNFGKSPFVIAALLNIPGVESWIVNRANTAEGQNKLLVAITNANLEFKKDEITLNFLLDSLPAVKYLLDQCIGLSISSRNYSIPKKLVQNKKISPNYVISGKPLISYSLRVYGISSESDLQLLDFIGFLLESGADINKLYRPVLSGKPMTILDEVVRTQKKGSTLENFLISRGAKHSPFFEEL